jgi:hypothetical protein
MPSFFVWTLATRPPLTRIVAAAPAGTLQRLDPQTPFEPQIQHLCKTVEGQFEDFQNPLMEVPITAVPGRNLRQHANELRSPQ